MATKKPIKRAPVAAKPAPAAKTTIACPVSCRCSFLTRLIVFGLIFAAGYLTCHYMRARPDFRGGMRAIPADMFVDGCLDTAKLQNDRMPQRIDTADKDGDGCITMEELDAHRDEMRANPDMRGKPMMRR
ncbi:MAG: hypothetical protein WC137_01620 [Alphaproteobacteria bacterium]